MVSQGASIIWIFKKKGVLVGDQAKGLLTFLGFCLRIR